MDETINTEVSMAPESQEPEVPPPATIPHDRPDTTMPDGAPIETVAPPEPPAAVSNGQDDPPPTVAETAVSSVQAAQARVLHGSQVRQYVNEKVTPHLLDAMKQLVVQDPVPNNPLQFLGDFLLQKSREVEGTT